MIRRLRSAHFLLAALLTLGLAQFPQSAAAAESTRAAVPIGTKIADVGTLRDTKGNRRPLHDFKAAKGYVAVFLGIDCPLAKLYLPRLVEMERNYRKQGVLFLAVYPHANETIDLVAAQAYDAEIAFPVLKDFNQKLADALGVTRTPEVCLLDKDFVLRYRGRIDDQYHVATRRPEPSRRDLAEAIDALVTGKPIERPEAAADGCLINRSRRKTKSEPVAFHKDVEPILQARCQECHRPGRIAPFSLLTYEDAKNWSDTLGEVVEQRRMPPWHADARYGHFSNNRSLSADEIATLASWVAQGTPEGDAKDAPPPRTWHEGWAIGKPDAEFPMAKDSDIPADGVLPYRYFTVPTNFTEDRWVQMAEARPGDPAVVHHIIVYMIAPGHLQPVDRNDDMQVLVEWAPGNSPVVCPPGTAIRVPKGAELIYEMHYTPNGKKSKDRSTVGVVFAKEPPRREIRTNIFAKHGIRIPARDPHHAEHTVHTFQKDAQLLALLPHMHWRGKDYHYEAIYPDGRTETLLSVPRWDFNWQTNYWFAEPIHMPQGAKIRAVAHWDNSINNPANPDPNRSVGWGIQSWDEMMVGWLTYVNEEPVAPPKDTTKNSPAAEALFLLFDTNRDGRIAAAEIPEKYRKMMDHLGLDADAGISRVAFELIYQELSRELFRRR